MEITVGLKGEVFTQVEREDTAKEVGSGDLLVYATPCMVALMEGAACEAIAEALSDTQTTVGTSLHIEHTSATPVGLEVTAEAEVTAVEGKVITFGIKEHRDCLAWVDFMVEHFGPDVKIILTGISMGASTVLIAAGRELPKNVIGVLADCGYNSAKDIIRKVIRQMNIPVAPGYFFVKLGARIFGHFDAGIF